MLIRREGGVMGRSCMCGEQGGVNGVTEGYVWGGELVPGLEQLSTYFAVRSVIFDGKFRFGPVRYGRGREY